MEKKINEEISSRSTVENRDNQTLALLSRRETEVLALAAKGYADKTISMEMGISLNTLRTYWQRIRSKIGERSRSSLAVLFADHLGTIQENSSEIGSSSDFEIDLVARTYKGHTEQPDDIEFPLDATLDFERLRQFQTTDGFKEFEAFLHLIESTGDTEYSFTRRVPEGGAFGTYNYHVQVIRDEAGKALFISGKYFRAIELGEPLITGLTVGTWETVGESRDMMVDDEFRKIYRTPPRITVPEFLESVYKSDREAVRRALDALLAGQTETAKFTHRLKQDPNRTIWVRHQVVRSGHTLKGTAISTL